MSLAEQHRFAWVVGLANGLLALLAVNTVYSAVSSNGIYLIPWWIATPYAAFTAWRAYVFVTALIERRANPLRPVLEGIALLGTSAAVYLLAGVVRAAAYRGLASWGELASLVFWIAAAATFGGAVALVLVALDSCVVWAWRALRE